MRRLGPPLLLCAALAGCDSFLDGGTKLDGTSSAGDARSYMNDALDIMQRASINRRKIDWTKFRADALARVNGVATTNDLYAAVTATVKALGDSHSGFYPPSNLPGTSNPAPSATNVPTGKLLGGRVAYVFVPFFSGTNPVGRADSTQAIIQSLDASGDGACGWIVDLRLNGGGNMYPMVAGLGPLLGDGVAGSFVDPDGNRQDWFYVSGAAGIAAAGAQTVLVRATTPYALRNPSPPVAVLYGAGTASSGEATAISFRGRPNTRSFGAPTFGVSTANQGFTLRDGALLNLTTAVMVDRAGKAYGAPVPPDEPVPSPSPVVPGAVDATVTAAMQWLAGQPACQSPS